MRIDVLETPELLGAKVAELAARRLNEAIDLQGGARMLMSTGASQFTTLEALVKQDVKWEVVEVFHLDEYIGISTDHPASFVNYLKERVDSKVKLKAFHFVDVSIGVEQIIEKLTGLINEKPVDVGLIGIGENAHVAFNDPPADFDDLSSFKTVELDDACRRQQLGEGWFPTLEDVPRQAITITVSQIMKCKCIISAVPFAVKAKAISDMLSATEITPMVPATILKTHPDYRLFLDKDSASLTDAGILERYGI